MMEQLDGGLVAVQNAIPVPTFDVQERPLIELSGAWRVERQQLDSDLTLTDRSSSLALIVAEAAGRESAGFDDADWETVLVPGSLNPPPRDVAENGAWYRRRFFLPPSWAGLAATLKAEAVNYVADLWLNGRHLGYHEGGYTPFAFDLSGVLVPGAWNVIAIRVDSPRWGSRNDIVPWGLTDWWNYGGITRPLWIEASDPLHVVRADVTPHLDGMDVSVVVRNAQIVVGEIAGASPLATDAVPNPTSAASSEGPEAGGVADGQALLRIDVLPARVTSENISIASASALVVPGEPPIASDRVVLDAPEAGEVTVVDTAFLLGGVDLWSPSSPALYVLRVTLSGSGGSDVLWTSFGLRHVAVQEDAPRLLLNGDPIMFTGVGLHDERIDPVAPPAPSDVTAHRITEVDELMEQLAHAREVDADLIRSGHAPANPLLLMLADRMGYAVWEEIPLYHFTPLTYGIAMERGIPQQMLREMALRDMNRPSVLFHGLSNESTGADERADALRELHEIDREVDGTRLTGQAAYGSMPRDPTHEPLDVAGFTFYYGVFYGSEPRADTARALDEAHDANPSKPILALEFGRWVDDLEGGRQQRVFEMTYPVFRQRSTVREDGYVGAAVWWTLEDFTTMAPRIALERFGLFRPDGSHRPAAETASKMFAASAGAGADQSIESDARRATVAGEANDIDLRLLGYLAYACAVSIGSMAIALAILVRRGGRGNPRPEGDAP